jgi:hypothetical protein
MAVALLAPDPRRIADPPAQPPADDRVADAVADGTPEPLRKLACPVGIDTGVLVKGFRADEHTDGRQRLGLDVARRYPGVERRARAALRTPPGLARTLAEAAHSVVSDEVVPTWPDAMPPPAPARLPATRRNSAVAVYLPVITDASSCTHGFREHAGVDVLDAVEWVHDTLLPKLRVDRLRSVVVHPTCASKHLGLGPRLEATAAALADEVLVPAGASCCGFAGDRGLLHPELAAAATRDEAAEIADRSFDAYLSSNRTCELGLQQATRRPYWSAVQVLEERTR